MGRTAKRVIWPVDQDPGALHVALDGASKLTQERAEAVAELCDVEASACREQASAMPALDGGHASEGARDVAAASKLFAAFDRNADGFISREELLDHLSKLAAPDALLRQLNVQSIEAAAGALLKLAHGLTERLAAQGALLVP